MQYIFAAISDQGIGADTRNRSKTIYIFHWEMNS